MIKRFYEEKIRKMNARNKVTASDSFFFQYYDKKVSILLPALITHGTLAHTRFTTKISEN